MQASNCPKTDTSCLYEYIPFWNYILDGLKLVNSKSSSKASKMPTDGTRTTYKDNANENLYHRYLTEVIHDGYAMSYWEYNALGIGQCVTRLPNSWKLSADQVVERTLLYLKYIIPDGYLRLHF